MTTKVRASILKLVRRYPALHVREIERHLGLPDRLAAYHLSSLEDAGLVNRARERGYVRYYATGTAWTRADMRRARVLRRECGFKISLLLLETQELTPGEVASKLGLSKATVSYHLALLQKGGLVQARDDGRNRFYSLRSAGEVRRLLHQLPRVPGLLDEFTVLWDDLVG